jgi:hypothetical protein
MTRDLSPYRRRAERARERAVEAKTPEAKQALLALADMWERVVQQIETLQDVFSLLVPKRVQGDRDEHSSD